MIKIYDVWKIAQETAKKYMLIVTHEDAIYFLEYVVQFI